MVLQDSVLGFTASFGTNDGLSVNIAPVGAQTGTSVFFAEYLREEDGAIVRHEAEFGYSTYVEFDSEAYMLTVERYAEACSPDAFAFPCSQEQWDKLVEMAKA